MCIQWHCHKNNIPLLPQPLGTLEKRCISSYLQRGLCCYGDRDKETAWMLIFCDPFHYITLLLCGLNSNTFFLAQDELCSGNKQLHGSSRNSINIALLWNCCSRMTNGVLYVFFTLKLKEDESPQSEFCENQTNQQSGYDYWFMGYRSESFAVINITFIPHI